MANGMPKYDDYLPDGEGRELLRETILQDQHTDDEILVPTRIRQPIVLDVLRDVLKPSIELLQFRRVCDTTRFYRARPAVQRFLELLDKRERETKQVQRSARALCVVGELGDAGQLKTAAEYYDYLLHHRNAEEAVLDLIACYFYLDAGVKEKVPADWLDEWLDRVKPPKKGGGEDKNADERNKVEHYRFNLLPMTTAAKAARLKVQALPEDTERATAIARLYLGVDDPGAIEWKRWASYATMEEVERAGPKPSITGMRAALGALDPKLGQDFVKLGRARATRAIGFLGGTLSDEESAWLAFGETPKFQLQP